MAPGPPVMTDTPTTDTVHIKQAYSREVEHESPGALNPNDMAGVLVSAHEQKDSVEHPARLQMVPPYIFTKQKDNEQATDGQRQLDTAMQTESSNSSSSMNDASQQRRAMQHSGSSSQNMDVSGQLSASSLAYNNGTLPQMAKPKAGGSDLCSTHSGKYQAQQQEQQHFNGQNQRSHYSRKPAAPLNQIIDPHMYNNNDIGSDPVKAHYVELMRRSIHRLVSSTTRFDRVTTGALSLLADLACLYLLRIGEACRSRADLANRCQPNLLDMADCTTQDLGVDWSELHAWVNDWRNEVGTVAESPPIDRNENANVGAKKQLYDQLSASSDLSTTLDTASSRRGSWDSKYGKTIDRASAPYAHQGPMGDLFNGLYSSDEANQGAAHGSRAEMSDVDEMVADLDLKCLLLDDASAVDKIEGIIPSHFPPLVPINEAEEEEEEGEEESHNEETNGAEQPLEIPKPAVDYSTEDTVDDKELASEESAENAISELLQITSSSLSALQPSITSDKTLFAFFKPAAKFDPTCAPEDALPDFEIPEEAVASATEHEQRELSTRDKTKPGYPMFLLGDATKRNLLGDSEEQWRQTRHRGYPSIHNEAANQAMDEMSNAPVPMRHRSESIPKQAVDEESSTGKQITDSVDSSVAKNAVIDIGDTLGLDLDMEVDLGMDLGLDLDLDLDILNSTPDLTAGFQFGNSTKGDNGGDDSEANHVSQGEQVVDMSGFSEAKNSGANAVSEPIELPISSGLRGSGKQHWASEWFTPAMSRRLSKMTAQDVAPCDSLFLSNPSASRRFVVDDIARAFIDSEGGGHLHETTPLEGFGSNANTQSLPNSSGSALRWTLHHIMQTKGKSSVDSLYTGRSSLAGGIAGDGVSQYISRISSLIKASEEEEAELAVNGALGLATAKDSSGNRILPKDRGRPGQNELAEQLIAGSEKRIPWMQHKLDIHIVESRAAGREPQRAVHTPPPPPPQTPASAALPLLLSPKPATPPSASSAAAAHEAVPAESFVPASELAGSVGGRVQEHT